MKPLLPNTYVLNNKYLQSIISPSTDIIDYNFTSEQVHKLNLLQILRPDIYFNKNLSEEDFLTYQKNTIKNLLMKKLFINQKKNIFYIGLTLKIILRRG